MFFIKSMIAALAVFGIALAADTASAPAPVKAPTVAAAPSITWYGMAMLRLRDEIWYNKLKSGVKEESSTFQLQKAYHLGVKIKPNDQVLLQFDIGNDWYATELATGIPGDYYTKRNPMTPWFNLAYAQWDPGYLHLVAGIIPVKGSALMDLIGVSILFNKSYKTAAHVPWGVVTNFSQTGLRLGAPVLKDEFKLGVDLTSAIIEHHPIGFGLDSMNFNSSAIEFLLEVPMTVANFAVKPQLILTPNRTINTATQKSDMEMGAGLDLGYKINEQINVRAGFGYAHNSNNNSFRAGDSVAKDPFNPSPAPVPGVSSKTLDKAFDRTGTNTNVGTTVVLGPGKLDFDFNYSTEINDKDTTVNDAYPFVDLKYGWMVNKNFVIMPRCRFFISLPKVAYDSKANIRPELIFAGSF